VSDTDPAPVPGERAATALDPGRALEVLEQLRAQLGDVDPEVRAIVALRATGPGSVALVDVTLHENRILEPPDDAAGLVVVTGEQVTEAEGDPASVPAPTDEVVELRQLVCILPSGDEVGVYTTGDDPEPHRWSITDDPDGTAETLRPRDVASNSARRAFGLPSLVDLPAMTDILARAWLLAIAGEAMRRFDGPEGLQDVTSDDLERLAELPPLGDLPQDPDELPTWEEVHRTAVAGELELGSFTVDVDHAAWLDPAGLAQLLDVTLPPTEELLGSLKVVGDDDLLGWAIGWLAGRGWFQPV
jgi:hypothetical protein